MPKSRGTLEFADARRSPVELPADMIIGRAAGSRLRLYDNGVSDRHAQITVDAEGAVWIQDLESQAGTLRNGARVEGKQKLDDGDQLQLGPTVLIFRMSAEAKAAAAAPKPAPVTLPKPAPAPVAAKPAEAPRKVAAADRTMVPQDLPPEVKAFIKAREEAEKAKQAGAAPPAPAAAPPVAASQKKDPRAFTPTAPLQPIPAGIVVGAPEQEPSDHRTVQMDAGEVERLMAARGITAPAITAPTPSPQAAAKGTLTMDAADIERQLISEQIIPGGAPSSEQGSKATSQMDSNEINRLWAAESKRAQATGEEQAPLPPPPGAAPSPSKAPVDTMEMQAVVAPQAGYVSAHANTAEFEHPPAQGGLPRGTQQGFPAQSARRSSPDLTPTGMIDSPPSPTGRRKTSSPDVTPTDIVDPLPAPSARKLVDSGVPSFAPPSGAPPSGAPPAQQPSARSTLMGAPSAPLPPKPAPAPVTAPTMMAPAPPPLARPQPTAPTMMAPSPGPIVPPPIAAPVAAPVAAPAPGPTMMAPAPVVPIAQPMQTATGVPAPVGYQPTAPVAPLPPPQPVAAQPYTPPKKGSFGSFSRAFEFMGQMFTLARQNGTLLKPLIYDLAITTPLSIGIAAVLFFVNTRAGAYAVLSVGTALLYFVDYACNSLTASLIFDHVTTGNAQMSSAAGRVKKALPGIMLFAAVSALLDVASTYARERRDVVSRILINILRSIWTTATYVIMPSLVIEGVSFGDALKRSKELMSQDPTGVGAGVVAMSITSYVAAIVIFPTAYFALRYGSLVHPVLGAVLFFLLVNLYWSVSGWMKISYATCFYLWARECERNHSQDHSLAPAPLRSALDAA